jgi:hypothetical protein
MFPILGLVPAKRALRFAGQLFQGGPVNNVFFLVGSARTIFFINLSRYLEALR